MDVTFTPEQQELRRTLRALADDRATPADLRRVLAAPAGYDVDLWRLLAGELELTETASSFVDAAVVLEEAGRALLPVPLLPSIVAAAVLDRAGVDRPAPERIGSLAVAAERDTARDVVDGHVVQTLLVATPDALLLVEDFEATVQQSVDGLRRLSTVHWRAESARPIGGADDSARAVDLLRVALAVEAVGVARRCLEMTVEHLKTRVQFGKPLGSFQALQHRAADMAVTLEAATSTAYVAAWTAAEAPADLPVIAPLAKAVCADAAWRIAAEMIQMHGGIGFTWEHDAHLYFKRAFSTRMLLGDSHVQRRVVAARASLL